MGENSYEPKWWKVKQHHTTLHHEALKKVQFDPTLPIILVPYFDLYHPLIAPEPYHFSFRKFHPLSLNVPKISQWTQKTTIKGFFREPKCKVAIFYQLQGVSMDVEIILKFQGSGPGFGTLVTSLLSCR